MIYICFIGVAADADTLDVTSWCLATLHRASGECSTASHWARTSAAKTNFQRPGWGVTVHPSEQSEVISRQFVLLH